MPMAGVEPARLLGTAPSRQRVYQFHHIGTVWKFSLLFGDRRDIQFSHIHRYIGGIELRLLNRLLKHQQLQYIQFPRLHTALLGHPGQGQAVYQEYKGQGRRCLGQEIAGTRCTEDGSRCAAAERRAGIRALAMLYQDEPDQRDSADHLHYQ